MVASSAMGAQEGTGESLVSDPKIGGPMRARAGGLCEDAAPDGAGLTSSRGATRPRWWGEILVIVFLAWAYDTIANLAPLREKLALAHGSDILSFERSLHIAPEAALNSWLVAHDTFGTLLSYYYDNAHFIVTFGLLGWLWWKRADIYRPLRSSLVAINVIGLLVFWLYPVAPPRMLSGFTDVIASSHTFGSGTRAASRPTPTSSARCPHCISPGQCGAPWFSGGSPLTPGSVRWRWPIPV